MSNGSGVLALIVVFVHEVDLRKQCSGVQWCSEMGRHNFYLFMNSIL